MTLTANDTASIRWYSSFVGGALVGTGSTFVSPVLFRDTIFYAEAGSACPSARLGLNVTVNTTQMPIGTDGSRCGDGVVSLSASSAFPITWYDAVFGGNIVGSGSIFNTPSLSANTYYYAEANAGCPSERAQVLAIVTPIPDAPITADESRCGIGEITLVATSPHQVYWYDAPIGGNLLYTGTNFTTPVLTASTLYYAEAGFDCRSPRDTALAIINDLPQVFLGNDTVIATGATVVLDAGVGFVSYAWSNGSSAQTITVGVTGTYTVLVLDSNGCANSDAIHVEVPVSVNEDLSMATTVLIYPNPATEILNIEIFSGRNAQTQIRLLDIQGRTLQMIEKKIEPGQNKLRINLHDTTAGIYFLEVSSEQSKKVLRIVRE